MFISKLIRQFVEAFQTEILYPKFRNSSEPHLLRPQDLVSHQLVAITQMFIFAFYIYNDMWRLDILWHRQPSFLDLHADQGNMAYFPSSQLVLFLDLFYVSWFKILSGSFPSRICFKTSGKPNCYKRQHGKFVMILYIFQIPRSKRKF